MVYDYSKLRGKIREVYKTQSNYAKDLGIGRVSLSKRLNSQLQFSQDEILNSIKLLGLNNKDIPSYFFTVQV
jgi:hypothetical protein